MIDKIRKLIANKSLRHMRSVNFTIVPRQIETHYVICVAMAQEKAVLSQVISHILKIVYPDIGVKYVTH